MSISTAGSPGAGLSRSANCEASSETGMRCADRAKRRRWITCRETAGWRNRIGKALMPDKRISAFKRRTSEDHGAAPRRSLGKRGICQTPKLRQAHFVAEGPPRRQFPRDGGLVQAGDTHCDDKPLCRHPFPLFPPVAMASPKCPFLVGFRPARARPSTIGTARTKGAAPQNPPRMSPRISCPKGSACAADAQRICHENTPFPSPVAVNQEIWAARLKND